MKLGKYDSGRGYPCAVARRERLRFVSSQEGDASAIDSAYRSNNRRSICHSHNQRRHRVRNPRRTIQPTPAARKAEAEAHAAPRRRSWFLLEPSETTPGTGEARTGCEHQCAHDQCPGRTQRQQTTSLLGSAESNLSNIHRSLSGDEQQMVSQIRNYIAQSRKAMSDGDLERAYNLANKANLLSSELVKE